MNNKSWFVTVILLCLTVSISRAQRLVVFSVAGGPKLVTPEGNTPIKAYDNLTMSSVVSIPYDASLELIDEANRKQYIIKTPGRDKISAFVSNRKNSAVQLTQRFMEYIQKQVTSGTKISARRFSDAATVTRETQTYQKEEEEELDEFAKEFADFDKQAKEEYETFRNQCNQEYADFMEEAWSQFRSEKPIPAPKEEEVKPLTLPEKERGQQFKGKPVVIQEFVAPLIPTPQPLPINYTIQTIPDEVVVVDPQLPTVPILINNSNISVAPIELLRIDSVVRPKPVGQELAYYGTKVFVRYTPNPNFKLPDLSERSISEAWTALSSESMENTLIDCLNIRKQLRLSDWGYLLLLEQVGQACLGKGSNEATLLSAYLFCQSGYKMRLGKSKTQMILLFGSRHLIYDKSYFTLSGENFYPLHTDEEELSICNLPYPEEQGLSLLLVNEPILKEVRSDKRTLSSTNQPQLKVSVDVNKNLLDFYSDYPASQIGGDMLSRWAMYANTPLDVKVKEQLYPALKEKLKGKSEKEAVSILLDFVQWSLTYKYDEDIWGYDRAFFAEETLFYPYADCEDRSILFSRLVRDLVGLKVVLVYYPGHLASAVHFNENVEGDYLEHEGKRFVICDATYFGAPIGKTMSGMDNKTAKAVLLD